MNKTHPFFNLFIIACIAFGSLIVAQFVGITIATLVYQLDFNQLQNVLASPEPSFPHIRQIYWIIQGFSLLVGLGGGAFLYQFFVSKQKFSSLNISKNIDFRYILLTIFIFIASFPLTSEIMRWNSGIHFGSLDASIRGMEEQAALLTKILTDMQSLAELLIVLVVIAFVPAFAEEYLFRGLVQKELIRWIPSKHIAIVVTAMLFSAIHLQFLGFFPRMFLGILLGYVYCWSGNIWYPIVGHFANNGVQVIALYLFQQKIILQDVSEDTSFPVGVVVFATLLLVIFLGLFWKRHSQKNTHQPLPI